MGRFLTILGLTVAIFIFGMITMFGFMQSDIQSDLETIETRNTQINSDLDLLEDFINGR